jgi:hypothetical protein
VQQEASKNAYETWLHAKNIGMRQQRRVAAREEEKQQKMLHSLLDTTDRHKRLTLWTDWKKEQSRQAMTQKKEKKKKKGKSCGGGALGEIRRVAGSRTITGTRS